ncbi:MAG: hypothetical protein DWI27_07985 [Planctomycetota bacterium]|jgi:hypothetical protein|nr:MAG: hypothetical protein DWI27_07985 [Planctomycetota bacterium]
MIAAALPRGHRGLGLTLVLLGLLLLGCGGPRRPDPTRANVTGSVTLDGKPLAEGEILFLAVNGEAVDTLRIANGSFSGSVSIGPQRVRLAAYTMVKRSVFPDKPPVDVRENALPAKYHAGSTLTAEIKPGTNPPLSFDLKSEPKKPAGK